MFLKAAAHKLQCDGFLLIFSNVVKSGGQMGEFVQAVVGMGCFLVNN